MLRFALASIVRSAVHELIAEGLLPAEVSSFAVEIADPRQPEHGDFATNFAMVSSKSAGQNPRTVAELLRGKLAANSAFQAVDVAGPGFINFRLSPPFAAQFVQEVIDLGPKGLATASQAWETSQQRINVEFVSVNPNGPITIGSGRGAAFGSTLCNVLEAAGNVVHREYYINDGVNSEQMRLFAESVRALVEGRAVPENGYKGDYVVAVAESLKDAQVSDYRKASEQLMIEAQRSALNAFGVEYDTWFSEQSLHDSGRVEAVIAELVQKGIADSQPVRTKLKLAKGGKIEDVEVESQPVDEDDAEGNADTLWLRSTRLGDDMDRVLRRKDGRLTYIASDIAYHQDKLNRPANADRLITILGPDHHGYIGRLTAVMAALALVPDSDASPVEDETYQKLYRSVGEQKSSELALAKAKEQLQVVIYQLVRFLKDGKPAPMRKRDGNIYALIDLMKEIGAKVRPDASEDEQIVAGRDVARFFYLMRHHDTTFDFDLDLAARQSDENPVFYVQYAHARICSILSKASEAGLFAKLDAEKLGHSKEIALIKKVTDLPEEVMRAAKDYGVHRLATFAVELARSFHAFYDSCRVINLEDRLLSESRLALCEAARVALRGALALLEVSAPERMLERADVSAEV